MLRVAHPTGSQFKGYEPYQAQDLALMHGWGAIDASVG